MTLSSLAVLATFALAPTAADSGTVAIQAGTIHIVEDGGVIEDGTLLIKDGKIVAVGADLDVPPGARVVDYGPSAVIVPGFVAASSSFGSSAASPRTAEPGVAAIDGFDRYTPYHTALQGGVTSVYLAPARGRLIAGQGAVVKAAGDGDADRVLAERSALHGSISRDARRTPGYWEPPVPATVDVGMGFAKPQLPRTTMGAVVALNELLLLAGGDESFEETYGDTAGGELKELMDSGRTWRMGAESMSEVRAILEFSTENGLPLVIEGATGAAELADDIAAAGFSVIASPPTVLGRDFGKSRDADWPEHGAIADLMAAGVKVAITCPPGTPVGDLIFCAGLARRGGVSGEDALRAITLDAAEILGVEDRVGSLTAGKDADFVVMSGAPFSGSASVLTTWSSGEEAWTSRELETAAVVLEVEELHIGDGETLIPGQILIRDGEIAEVGRRVSHPVGATVVRGFAAMPGMIDTFGHLGLEGSTKKFSSRIELPRIVEPGDYADRRVAQAGVTTVNLASRADPGGGAPTMAYKPAGEDFDHMIVAPTSAIHMEWSESVRAKSGERVRKALEKAKKYADSWDEYEKKIAEWEPPAAKEKDGDDEDDDEDEDAEEDEEDDGKKKSKKKKKKDDDEPKIATGVWQGMVEGSMSLGETKFRLQVLEEDGELSGNLRCAELSSELIEIHGRHEDGKLHLEGFGTRGPVEVELEVEDDALKGVARTTGVEVEVEIEQASKEFRVAGRPERRREKAEKAPKGKPSPPGLDRDLEPVRRAMNGEGTVIVTVHREDEILDCVDAFEEYGIAPVLFGAERAGQVAEEIVGRVSGILLPREVRVTDPRKGLTPRNPYAELAAEGIPVAFHSGAEEGAVELPLFAAYAVARGMSPAAALRALTYGAAEMLSISHRVGALHEGLDGDVLLLDGEPLDPATSVLRVWVSGKEIR